MPSDQFFTLRLVNCRKKPTLPSSTRCNMSHPVGLTTSSGNNGLPEVKSLSTRFCFYFGGRTWHLFILNRRYMLGYSTVTNRITCTRGHPNQVRSWLINPRFLWAPALVHGNYIEAVGRIRFAISSIFLLFFVHVFFWSIKSDRRILNNTWGIFWSFCCTSKSF